MHRGAPPHSLSSERPRRTLLELRIRERRRRCRGDIGHLSVIKLQLSALDRGCDSVVSRHTSRAGCPSRAPECGLALAIGSRQIDEVFSERIKTPQFSFGLDIRSPVLSFSLLSSFLSILLLFSTLPHRHEHIHRPSSCCSRLACRSRRYHRRVSG